MTALPTDSLLDPALRDRAHEAALTLGESLLRECTEESTPELEVERGVSRTFSGTPGFALAFLALYRATGDTRYEAATHEFFKRAAHAQDRPHTGLFSGISGLRAAAQLATRLEPRYDGLVQQCDRFIESELPSAPEPAKTYGLYDLISGWSGVRLGRCVDGPREPDRLIDHLAWLLEDDARWRCPHPLYDNGPENDLGLAHGVAGMLAAFGLTLREIPDDYRERVHAQAHRLAGYAVQSNGITAWPSTVQKPPQEHYRHGWCYGSPGICVALASVAAVLGDDELLRFAGETLAGVAQRTPQEWMINEATICHGTIGNALCFASLGVLTKNESLLEATQRAVGLTLEIIESHAGKCLTAYNGGMTESIGELTGSAGVVLSLLTLSGAYESDWMRCHGLAPIH